MILREFIEVTDDNVYLVDEDGNVGCMVNTYIFNPYYYLNEDVLNRKVINVFVLEGQLRVCIDER
jgi:hypothetical protein